MTDMNQTKEIITIRMLAGYRQLLGSGKLGKRECRRAEDKLREIHRSTAGITQMQCADLIQDYESFYTQNWL